MKAKTDGIIDGAVIFWRKHSKRSAEHGPCEKTFSDQAAFWKT